MLEGRRIIVTGGASGIGAAVMRGALERGARVHCFDLAMPTAAQFGASMTSSLADITDMASVEKATRDAAEAMGGIDGVANVAGLGSSAGHLESTDLAQWRRILDVNLMGTLHVSAAALPYLNQCSAASIVNVSSGAALRPFPGSGAYAAAKRGVLALTQAWAMELGPGVRVNAVCPGAIDTPMLRQRNAQADAGGRPALSADMYALKRFGSAAEVANAICFLLGSEASYITGVTLPVDGGRTFH